MNYGWSIDGEQWRLQADLVAQLPGVWRKVRLRTLDQDSVSRKSGVYMICAKASSSYSGHPDLLYNALYVGQAISLRQRFMGHCQSPSSRLTQAKLCFSAGLDFWFIEAAADLLDELERTLIAVLGPAANIQAGNLRGVVKPPRPA